VHFTDTSTGTLTAHLWDFGDGTISTVQHPAHVYTTTGAYTVSLNVSGPGGGDRLTRSGYIVVTSDGPLTAGFAASPLAGQPPLTVVFTDTSTGAVTDWLWSFGDGGTSTAQHPTHTYTLTGAFTVSLTASGPGGSDTEVKAGYIQVSDEPIIANFTAQPTSGPAPLTVQFTDGSAGDITSWQWAFGDGGTSTLPNPTHVYATAGTYTVMLMVSGPEGSDTETKARYITVQGGHSIYLPIVLRN
jgi:PKD repeat protein